MIWLPRYEIKNSQSQHLFTLKVTDSLGRRDELVSHPGGVKDSHPLNTTEIGDKRRLHGPLGS